MSKFILQQISENTFNVTGPYQELYDSLKQTMVENKGSIIVDEKNTGQLEAKWRYGVNAAGLRVTIRFNSLESGQTQITIKGHFKDSIDTFGAAKKKARKIIDSFQSKFPDQDAAEIQSSSPNMPPMKPQANAPAPPQSQGTIPYRGKQKTVAGIFALLFGSLGIHKFYLGSWGWGIIYVLLAWTFAPAIVAVIEGIIFLCMKDEKFDSRYNYSPGFAFKW